MNPAVAALLAGASLSLLVDEGLTPALGFSAPNRAYPVATHFRGLAARLANGLGVAAAAEFLCWLGHNAVIVQATNPLSHRTRGLYHPIVIC
jgi:hypothetical protein